MTAIDVQATAPLGFEPVAPLRPVAAPHTDPPALSATASRVHPAVRRRLRWERRYRLRLRVSDLVAVVAAASVAGLVDAVTGPAMGHPLTLISAGMATVALVSATHVLTGSRHTSATETVPAEISRVSQSVILAFAVLAVGYLLFTWPGVRGQLLIGMPVALVASLAGRGGCRLWLAHQRRSGRCTRRVLVAGTRADAAAVIADLDKDPQFDVVGIAIADDAVGTVEVGARSVPILGTTATLPQQVRDAAADAVLAVGPSSFDAHALKQLSWALEGSAAELIVPSGPTDVDPSRMRLVHTGSTSLVQVQLAQFDGTRYRVKRLLDIVLAALALIPIAVIGVGIAIAIRWDDHGPVFFRQVRAGRDGQRFQILKFRTMCTDAERQREALRDANEGAGPLFKMRDDPRVTRVGKVLRAFSLDELPQFWNVLRGDMSIVGPRPPLPEETLDYEERAQRRLFIKPGITGPWQIGGRSDLSWEESIRLDLSYVENWSVGRDLRIMWHTARVMIDPKGAY